MIRQNQNLNYKNIIIKNEAHRIRHKTASRCHGRLRVPLAALQRNEPGHVVQVTDGAAPRTALLGQARLHRRQRPPSNGKLQVAVTAPQSFHRASDEHNGNEQRGCQLRTGRWRQRCTEPFEVCVPERSAEQSLGH